MIAAIVFEFPLGWLFALPLGVALAFAIWRQRRRGVATSRIAGLGALRAMAMLVLVFLAARPIWMTREPPASATRSVMLLMDRSESMSLEERDVSRYQQALGFLRERLLPALQAASLPVQAMLFDQNAEPADGAKLAAATPNGKRTNLGGAVAQALDNAAQPPLAVIALTDGIVNESADNTHARRSWTRACRSSAWALAATRGCGRFPCARWRRLRLSQRRPPSALRRSLK